jgi:penicillin-binding protein 1A
VVSSNRRSPPTGKPAGKSGKSNNVSSGRTRASGARPRDKRSRRSGGLVLQAFLLLVGALCVGALGVALYVLVFLLPNLPSLETLIDYKPRIPLRVYTSDNVLIGEFGEERRDFVPVASMPEVMKKAIVAAEDDKFYEHGGVDFIGIGRAAIANVTTRRTQGASTITMQVARNFLLTRKQTYSRKVTEIALAWRIEEALSKDKILELYMNQIYLGERAYGFGSAARAYFGKKVQDLTLAEAAMLAGLPKAPATINPVVNPPRARERQLYVLRRMLETGAIDQRQYQAAQAEKVVVRTNPRGYATNADYAAEMARQMMVGMYKDDVYSAGYVVTTTLVSTQQDAAYAALRRGVLDYDRRHGYRGPEARIELRGSADEREDDIDDVLGKHPDSAGLEAAVVLSASPKAVRARLRSGETVNISGDGLRFAAQSLAAGGAAKTAAERRIGAGSVIRVTKNKDSWSISQLPEVAAAFIAIDPKDGAIRATVGGFDFGINKFDHSTQAWRQPGSTIKPFIYSAALEKGFSPGSMINDAQFEQGISDNGGPLWNPGNDDNKYDGPVTMRTGLKRSKNMVSIRLLRDITPAYAREFLGHFGFPADKHPANLTLTLGTGSVTPLQMAGAYSVFANGGYQVQPYLIARVVDANGKLLSQAQPSVAGDEGRRVLDARNAWLMDSMLRDVVRGGTGYQAGQRVGRTDLAGKTGTTNDALDGWFAGYGGNLVGIAWMGYDQPRSLGAREFGATLALPIWADFMKSALRGVPPAERSPPAGLLQANGDWSYKEYLDGREPKTLGVDEQKSFWDRLFQPGGAAPGGDGSGGNGVMPGQPGTGGSQERRRQQEMYQGG